LAALVRKEIIHKWVSKSPFFRRSVYSLISFLENLILGGYKEPAVLDRLQSIRRSREMLLTTNEAFILYSLVGALKNLPGDMAEVGVFNGCSAQVICEAKGDRVLHLFDTFEGLPEPAEFERELFARRDFSADLSSVQKALIAYPGVQYYQGLFPATAQPVKRKKFSLVHLDVDLYQSTLDSLKFFYPRMVKGGVILSHDYAYGASVRQAFAEFLADKPEQVFELINNQCMVVKQ
jgi:O-methyltransferase